MLSLVKCSLSLGAPSRIAAPPLDDARLGLRITHYKKRGIIAFSVAAEQVTILGIFYGGQDVETILQDDSDVDSKH